MKTRIRVARTEPLQVPLEGAASADLTDGTTRVALTVRGEDAVIDDAALAHFPGKDRLTLEMPGGVECPVTVLPCTRR